MAANKDKIGETDTSVGDETEPPGGGRDGSEGIKFALRC